MSYIIIPSMGFVTTDVSDNLVIKSALSSLVMSRAALVSGVSVPIPTCADANNVKKQIVISKIFFMI